MTIQETAKSQNKHICQSLHFSEEYLGKCEIVTNLECPLKNCNDIFSNRSALNLHLEKVHRISLKNDKLTEYTATRSKSKKTKLEENCKCEYYCPHFNCKYSIQGKRTLPTFHSLKVHFIRIHGDKKHKCPRCEKSFSIKSEMERHEKNCGQIIRCDLCSINYSTQQSYRKHCLKKGHTIEASILPIRSNETNSSKSISTSENLGSSKNTISNNMEIRPIPFIILPVCPTNAMIVPSQSNNDVQLIVMDHQRSLGCQTNVQTQDTGSQTKTNEMNQQQTQTITLTYASQFTSTTATTGEHSSISGVQHEHHISGEEYFHDAATSTSPPLIREEDIELFLMNDISTQTIGTQQPDFDQFRSISIQTHDSAASIHDYVNLNQAYFDIEMCPDGQHQHQQQRNLQNSTIKAAANSLNASCFSLNKSQLASQRCVTPLNMCNAPSQTEDLYFTSILGTSSIQTQTSSSRNGAQTQTEFDFS